MFSIKCPFCGLRGEKEFSYIGDANVKRPNVETASDQEWINYIYFRKNPKGWHDEYWQHLCGCRAIVKVRRNTVTHEIEKTLFPFKDEGSGLK